MALDAEYRPRLAEAECENVQVRDCVVVAGPSSADDRKLRPRLVSVES